MIVRNELEIYENNIECIKKTNCLLWENIKENIEYKEQVYIDTSVKSELIVAIEKENYIWYLNSRYDAQWAVCVWAGEKKEIVYSAPIIVFGFGNGFYVRKLRELYSENVILIYEPSMALFDCVLKNIDLADVLSDEKIIISVGEKKQNYFFEYLSVLINNLNFRHLVWKVLPNYQRIFPIEYLKMQKMYVTRIQNLVADRNTELHYEIEFARNKLQNTWSSFSSCSINSLREQLREHIDVENYPVIIVSAGPSLDKNVQYLKEAKNKAYIIVVDTALKTVLRAGITPDITVTIDPIKPLILFEDDRIKNLPMVVYTSSNKDVLKNHQGRLFFFDGSEYCADIYKKYGKIISTLTSGGSVSDIAFSLAQFIGFKKMILMGLDLGYPENKTHTKDAYDMAKTVDVSNGKGFEVEDIYGNRIWTVASMDKYRRWLEMQIEKHSELKVIDATEGGAKIRGTEIITLQEAIERECKDVKVVDFKQIMEETVPIFTQEELEEIKQQLWDIPKELEIIKDVLDKGIVKYEKLKKLAKNVSKNAKKIKKQINEIKETTDWLDKKSEMNLVKMYSKDTDYALREKAFNIERELKNEFITIAENGIEALKSYAEAIDKLKEDLHILYDSMEDDARTETI